MPWYVYMHCVYHFVYSSVHVKVKGQLTGDGFLPYCVVPWGQTQAIKLAVGFQHLSHLINPTVFTLSKSTGF